MQNEVSFDESRYRRKAIWAVLAIVVFIVVYLVLVAAAVGLSIVAGILGYHLVVMKPHWITVALALGGISFGLFMIYILVRFLFEANDWDESRLMLVTEKDEPRLHALIAETAAAAGCKMPRTVYLNGEVNASVSFPSSMSGLFLPSTKRLTIGLGLMEALSVTELKAVLAHEFGHFSQRSMRVGAYVYQVNRILHSVLVQRESEMKVVEQVESSLWIFALVAAGAKGAMYAVRWILARVYSLVNLAHLALAREMEFHADMVAAEVTGSEALSRALMRLHLASFAESALFGFYERKIPDAIKTDNVFPQLQAVIAFFGNESKMEFVGGLPMVPPALLAKFNRSKLVINNQWESHPSTVDRLKALAAFPAEVGSNIVEPSVSLLNKADAWQSAATITIFQAAKYDKPITMLTKEAFVAEMKKEHAEASFDPIYNGYFDDKLPIQFEVDEASKAIVEDFRMEELCSDEMVESLYQLFALSHDIEILKHIAQATSGLKTFDYDGKRYKRKHAAELLAKLEAEENEIIARFKLNDVKIFQTALARARRNGQGDDLIRGYRELFKLVDDSDADSKMVHELRGATAFINQTLQVEDIYEYMKGLKKLEVPFTKKLREMRDASEVKSLLTEPMKKEIDAYLARDQRYFVGSSYDDAALVHLFNAMDNFVILLSKRVDASRRALMKLQAQYLHGS